MENSVFFQGSLQDGISLAIQQSKMVLAFVTGTFEVMNRLLHIPLAFI